MTTDTGCVCVQQQERNLLVIPKSSVISAFLAGIKVRLYGRAPSHQPQQQSSKGCLRSADYVVENEREREGRWDKRRKNTHTHTRVPHFPFPLYGCSSAGGGSGCGSLGLRAGWEHVCIIWFGFSVAWKNDTNSTGINPDLIQSSRHSLRQPRVSAVTQW